MKRTLICALCLLLFTSLLTGCRGRKEPMETIRPTTAPTTAPTTMPTVPPTSETTIPTTGTEPSETMDRGNGPLESTESTESTASTTMPSRNRTMVPMPDKR